MDAWKAITDLSVQGWDTLVHLGAGDGRDDLLREAPLRRLVLVEGDPAAAALLRTRARHRPRARVMECVVAPATDQARWYAHSVRDFDGLVRQDIALARNFPRLRCVAQTMVPTRSLESVLNQCLEDAAPDAAQALVVDIPLTEQEWLTVDAAATLARFRALVVTSVACPTVDWAAPAALRTALSAAGFIARPQNQQGGPTVFELDPLAWQLRLTQAHERVAALEAEVHRLRALRISNEHRHTEVRQAVARAEGALRALESILRPGSDDAV